MVYSLIPKRKLGCILPKSSLFDYLKISDRSPPQGTETYFYEQDSPVSEEEFMTSDHGKGRARVLHPGVARLTVALLVLAATFGIAEAKCQDSPDPGVDWSGCSKARLMLTGEDLSGTNFQRSLLTLSDFAGSKLVGADLSQTEISRTRFEKADLSKANFTKALGWRANLAEAVLAEADFS